RHQRALPAHEQRGGVHRVDPRRVRRRGRRGRQPRRLEPLQLRHPRRARAARGPDRRGAPLEYRGARGMAAVYRGGRARRLPRHREGPGRLPRGTRVPRRKGWGMSARLERLGGELKSPLLVTDLVNIVYLTGFESSNAALLVRPGGEATLYTDFRYIELAREVPDVEVELTQRALLADLGPLLTGTVQFEADVLPYAQFEHLSAGNAKLVPTNGIVDALRAVKDAEELAKIARAARIADRALEALTAETWVGRSERELAWRLHELVHAHGADQLSFDTIVAAGPNGALPHATPTDRIVDGNTL